VSRAATLWSDIVRHPTSAGSGILKTPVMNPPKTILETATANGWQIEAGPVVSYGVDLGAAKGDGGFAWSRVCTQPGFPQDMSKPTRVHAIMSTNAEDIGGLATWIAHDLKARKLVMLGFEAPMWIPCVGNYTPRGVLFNGRFPCEQGNYVWHLRSAANASIYALAMGAELRARLDYLKCHPRLKILRQRKDVLADSNHKDRANLLLFEGYCADDRKVIEPLNCGIEFLTGIGNLSRVEKCVTMSSKPDRSGNQVTKTKTFHRWDAYCVASAGYLYATGKTAHFGPRQLDSVDDDLKNLSKQCLVSHWTTIWGEPVVRDSSNGASSTPSRVTGVAPEPCVVLSFEKR
jgi:hypothetical protein